MQYSGPIYQNQGIPTFTQPKKIFCAYHRTEFLTNFCIIKQCLMPLCPSCVAQHTQQHFKSSQKPSYVNLAQALYEVKQRCYAYIGNLQQCSLENDQLIQYRQNLSEYLHKQLLKCRQQISSKLDQLFQKYQSKLLKQIQQIYSQLNIYQPQQNQTIKQYISEQIQHLHDKIALLKSDQCLAALIRFYDHQLEQEQQGLKDINEYIIKHKKVGMISIRLKNEALNKKLENLCDDVLVLTHVKDQDKTKDQQKQNGKNPLTNKNGSNKNLSTQREKIIHVRSQTEKGKQLIDFQSKRKKNNIRIYQN